MNAATMNTRLMEAAKAVEDAHVHLEAATVAYAENERAYRRAKALAFLGSVGKNATERESRAELAEGVADLRYARDLAEGRKVAALEAVRSRRAILSANQTLTALVREEAAFSRTGPDGRP